MSFYLCVWEPADGTLFYRSLTAEKMPAVRVNRAVPYGKCSLKNGSVTSSGKPSDDMVLLRLCVAWQVIINIQL